ncbi:MAG: HD domain-containing protein [Methanocellales archaeon]
MKAIRDPIHGYIELDSLALALIDTPEVQRLRRIKQLGFANLVYPGANHTRFEHSLGTFYLAELLLKKIAIERDVDKDLLRAAALLHDLGHGPYSHVTERLLRRYLRTGHEDITFILKNTEVGEVLNRFGLNIFEVARYIAGKTNYGQILNSELDVDKMDYLVRDAHYTGVAYGLVDIERLIRQMKMHEGKLVVLESGVQAAESLLVSRFLMHPAVYFHHVSRIAETMFVRALEFMIEAGDLKAEELRKLDDYQIWMKMHRAGGYAKEMIKRIEERRLFKRALYINFQTIGEDILKEYNSHSKILRAESELCSIAKLENGYVLVDIPPLPEIEEKRSLVLTGSSLKPLEEVSPIVRVLSQAHLANWRMGVYTPPEYREKVGKIARDYFQVKKELKQEVLDLSYID